MRNGAYTIPDIQDVLRSIPFDKRVKQIVLFGSHAKGTAQPQSDLDFYLDSKKQITGLAYFDIKGRLEEAFQRDIDLIPDVDVIPDSPVDREIKRTGVLVYGN